MFWTSDFLTLRSSFIYAVTLTFKTAAFAQQLIRMILSIHHYTNQKVGVWGAISRNRIIGPIFFDDTAYVITLLSVYMCAHMRISPNNFLMTELILMKLGMYIISLNHYITHLETSLINYRIKLWIGEWFNPKFFLYQSHLSHLTFYVPARVYFAGWQIHASNARRP
jgi:hypothetical protein